MDMDETNVFGRGSKKVFGLVDDLPIALAPITFLAPDEQIAVVVASLLEKRLTCPGRGASTLPLEPGAVDEILSKNVGRQDQIRAALDSVQVAATGAVRKHYDAFLMCDPSAWREDRHRWLLASGAPVDSTQVVLRAWAIGDMLHRRLSKPELEVTPPSVSMAAASPSKYVLINGASLDYVLINEAPLDLVAPDDEIAGVVGALLGKKVTCPERGPLAPAKVSTLADGSVARQDEICEALGSVEGADPWAMDRARAIASMLRVRGCKLVVADEKLLLVQPEPEAPTDPVIAAEPAPPPSEWWIVGYSKESSEGIACVPSTPVVRNLAGDVWRLSEWDLACAGDSKYACRVGNLKDLSSLENDDWSDIVFVAGYRWKADHVLLVKANGATEYVTIDQAERELVTFVESQRRAGYAHMKEARALMRHAQRCFDQARRVSNETDDYVRVWQTASPEEQPGLGRAFSVMLNGIDVERAAMWLEASANDPRGGFYVSRAGRWGEATYFDALSGEWGALNWATPRTADEGRSEPVRVRIHAGSPLIVEDT